MMRRSDLVNSSVGMRLSNVILAWHVCVPGYPFSGQCRPKAVGRRGNERVKPPPPKRQKRHLFLMSVWVIVVHFVRYPVSGEEDHDRELEPLQRPHRHLLVCERVVCKYLFIYSFPKINCKFSIASRVRIFSWSRTVISWCVSVSYAAQVLVCVCCAVLWQEIGSEQRRGGWGEKDQGA